MAQLLNNPKQKPQDIWDFSAVIVAAHLESHSEKINCALSSGIVVIEPVWLENIIDEIRRSNKKWKTKIHSSIFE